MDDLHVYGFSFGDASAVLSELGYGTGREVPVYRRPPGGSGVSLFLTPVGGIAAATGTAPNLTPGVATCKLCEIYLDGSTRKLREVSPESTDTVLNIEGTSVGGSKLIKAVLIEGEWVADIGGSGLVDVRHNIAAKRLQKTFDGTSWVDWVNLTPCG